MEGIYPDSVAKMSFVMAVGRQAKEHLTEEFGIGEELAINIVGWRGSHLQCLAQMDLNFGDPKDEKERGYRIHQTAVMMRRGWACDSFSILAEGWVSTNPKATRDKDLVDEYVSNPSSDVDECLSILHVEDLGDGIHICALPFQVKKGKKISYGTLLHAEGSEMLRNQNYVDVLIDALEHKEADLENHDAESFKLALAMGIADEAGFFIQYDF